MSVRKSTVTLAGQAHTCSSGSRRTAVEGNRYEGRKRGGRGEFGREKKETGMEGGGRGQLGRKSKETGCQAEEL